MQIHASSLWCVNASESLLSSVSSDVSALPERVPHPGKCAETRVVSAQWGPFLWFCVLGTSTAELELESCKQGRQWDTPSEIQRCEPSIWTRLKSWMAKQSDEVCVPSQRREPQQRILFSFLWPQLSAGASSDTTAVKGRKCTRQSLGLGRMKWCRNALCDADSVSLWHRQRDASALANLGMTQVPFQSRNELSCMCNEMTSGWQLGVLTSPLENNSSCEAKTPTEQLAGKIQVCKISPRPCGGRACNVFATWNCCEKGTGQIYWILFTNWAINVLDTQAVCGNSPVLLLACLMNSNQEHIDLE